MEFQCKCLTSTAFFNWFYYFMYMLTFNFSCPFGLFLQYASTCKWPVCHEWLIIHRIICHSFFSENFIFSTIIMTLSYQVICNGCIVTNILQMDAEFLSWVIELFCLVVSYFCLLFLLFELWMIITIISFIYNHDNKNPISKPVL